MTKQQIIHKLLEEKYKSCDGFYWIDELAFCYYVIPADDWKYIENGIDVTEKCKEIRYEYRLNHVEKVIYIFRKINND